MTKEENLKRFENIVLMYKQNNMQLPSFELEHSNLPQSMISEILIKYNMPVIDKKYDVSYMNCSSNPTDEFFNHCGVLDLRLKTYIDGYDYIDVVNRNDDVIIKVSNKPMHGDGTYQSTDNNAKDITVEKALEQLKQKYNNKNIKIIYLKK